MTLIRFCFLALLVTGCATAGKEPPPKPFIGTRWASLLELPLPGEPPNFRFGDGRMQGFGGCNHVTARFVQDTVGAGYITIGRIESGMRGCDPAARNAEEHVLSVLQSVTSYSITGESMIMTGSAGSLQFHAIPLDAKY